MNKELVLHQQSPLSTETLKVLDEYYTHLDLCCRASELSENTVKAYKRHLSKFFEWLAANEPGDVTPDVIREWLDHLKQTGRAKAPATRNLYLAAVKAFYTWACGNYDFIKNPTNTVRGAKRKSGKSHKREILTDIEMRNVLSIPSPETLQGIRDRAIIYLMAFTAVRTVEVHRANLSDLRTEGNRLVLYVHGKGRGEADDKVVIASEAAQEAIHAWISERPDRNNDALFQSLSNRTYGGRLATRSIRELVKKHFANAGVVGDRKTTHSLRHTAISKAVNNGASLVQAQEMARHANPETTLIYFHNANRLSDPAEDKIDYDAED